MAVTALSVRPDSVKGRSLQKTYQAGGSLTVGNAGYIDSSGYIQAARANAAATTKGIGIVAAVQDTSGGVTTAASGDRVSLIIFGLVYGFSSLTPGALQYISSSSAGALTETAPSGAGTWTWAIGYAIDANTLFVQPGLVAPVSNS